MEARLWAARAQMAAAGVKRRKKERIKKLNLTTHYMNNEQFEAIGRGDRLLINGAWYEAGIAVTRAARELRRVKDGARMWLKRRFRGGAFVLELQAANPIRK
jgi:hypothetical protein